MQMKISEWWAEIKSHYLGFYHGKTQSEKWHWLAIVLSWFAGAILCIFYVAGPYSVGFLAIVLFYIYWNWFLKKIPQLLEKFFHWFLMVLILAYTLFNAGLRAGIHQMQNGTEVGVFSYFLAFSGFLAVALFISFFLYQGADRKFSPIIMITLYGWVWINFSLQTHLWVQILFLLFLTGSLLKSTRWLELLNRNHLFVFSGVLLIMLAIYVKTDAWLLVFKPGVNAFNGMWSLFLYFDVLYKVFLFTILLKIPVVLVYHHSLLSRKLKISGILQSTVPQIIQFVALLFVFYFIAGKIQTQILERQLLNYFNEHATGISAEQLEALGIDTGQKFKEKINDRIFIDTLQEHKQPIWIQSEKIDSVQVEFRMLSLDSTTFEHIFDKMTLINGNAIRVKMARADKWHRVYSRLIFSEKSSDWIFSPFLIPLPARTLFHFSKNGDGGFRIPVARLYIPAGAGEQLNNVLTLDIFWLGNWRIWENPFLKIIGLMLITIFLVNLLIVNKVSRLGDAIVKNILEKFAQLKEGIREISKGNLDFHIHMRGDDEFSEFAGHFNRMGRKLKENLEVLKEKERLNNEMEIARRVQQNLLPEIPDTDRPVQVAAKTLPATEVGGDFYDVIYTSDEQMMVAVGDVSGKGTSAAFYMAQFLSVWRQAAVDQSDILSVAGKLNEYFSAYLKEKQVFITCILGTVNTRSGEIEYVRAGHVRPLLYRHADDELMWMDSTGVGIGLVKNQAQFMTMTEVEKVRLETGDWLLFLTDGILEAYVQQEDKAIFWDEEQIERLVEEVREQSPQQIVDSLLNELLRFYNSQQLKDDSTLLLMKLERDSETSSH